MKLPRRMDIESNTLLAIGFWVVIAWLSIWIPLAAKNQPPVKLDEKERVFDLSIEGLDITHRDADKHATYRIQAAGMVFAPTAEFMTFTGPVISASPDEPDMGWWARSEHGTAEVLPADTQIGLLPKEFKRIVLEGEVTIHLQKGRLKKFGEADIYTTRAVWHSDLDILELPDSSNIIGKTIKVKKSPGYIDLGSGNDSFKNGRPPLPK